MAGGSTTPSNSSSVAKSNKVGKGSLLANFGKKKTSHFSVIDSGSKSPMGGSVGNKSVLIATTTSATKLGALSGSVGPRESKTPQKRTSIFGGLARPKPANKPVGDQKAEYLRQCYEHLPDTHEPFTDADWKGNEKAEKNCALCQCTFTKNKLVSKGRDKHHCRRCGDAVCTSCW